MATIGTQFGRLVVVGEAPPRHDAWGKKIHIVEVQCACGSPPKLVRLSNLRGGRTKSCGCFATEMTRQRHRERREAARAI
jgi:hypothetical protein